MFKIFLLARRENATLSFWPAAKYGKPWCPYSVEVQHQRNCGMPPCLADSVGIRNSPKKLRTTPKLIPERPKLFPHPNKKSELEGDKKRRIWQRAYDVHQPKMAERGIKNGFICAPKSIKTSPKETIKSSENRTPTQPDLCQEAMKCR